MIDIATEWPEKEKLIMSLNNEHTAEREDGERENTDVEEK